CHQYNSDPFTF
nr:immunoglobulin light chain junction region [Macaca mulatta]